jgi:hypothetical protein
MRITRTLTTAVAVAALVAPAAQANPAGPPDMHASVALAAAQAREQQERAGRPLGHAGDADWAPAVPTVSEDAAPAPVQVAAADDERSGGEAAGRDSGVRWSEIGRGVLAVLLAAGGLAILANYRTQQRLRAGA